MDSDTLEPADNENYIDESIAEFESQCESCGEVIREGDAIVSLDFEGYWVHKECGQ